MTTPERLQYRSLMGPWPAYGQLCNNALCYLDRDHTGPCGDGPMQKGKAIPRGDAPTPPPPTVRAWKCGVCGLFEATNMGPELGHVGAMSCRCGPMPACDPASLDLVPRAEQPAPFPSEEELLLRGYISEQMAAERYSKAQERAHLTQQSAMDLRDQLGDKDHAIAELHAKVGQLTMERDDALRKAGRR